MAGITGTTHWVLCPIVLLWIGSASARFKRGICPPGKDVLAGSSSDHAISLLELESTLPLLGQSRELKCAFPDPLPHGWNHDLNVIGVKLLWFKDNEQVSNTLDGRITITEDLVNVPDNISHVCLSSIWFPKSFLSILSIHNMEKSDYGVYTCHVVINNECESNSGLLGEAIHSTTLKGPDDTVWPKTLPKLTNECKTVLTCEVLYYDCCPCDTGLCEMMLLKDNKMVTSTTSVVTDAHVTKPHRAFTNAEEAHVSCLFDKWSLPATDPKRKIWEVVLHKDGKEIASKETPLSTDGTVQESFSMKRTLDVYGRYECMIRPTHRHRGCTNQSWFESSQIMIDRSCTFLQPHIVLSWIGTTTKHGCAFLVEHREVDRSEIVVTLQGNEVLRLDTIPLEDDGGNVVSAIFEIEVKDPTSFGIYDCTLEKDGLPDPSAKDITAESCFSFGDLLFHNTFQITPTTLWTPINSNRMQLKLGAGVYHVTLLKTSSLLLTRHHNCRGIGTAYR